MFQSIDLVGVGESGDYVKALSIFSWACDECLSWGEPGRHYASCEHFFHTQLVKGSLNPFKIESGRLASFPFQQLSLGCSVSYSYRVVIWD